MGADTTVCEGTHISLDATYPGATGYRWSNGAATPRTTATQAGDYHVEITSQNGCIGYDTITVSWMPPPIVNLGNDTGICDRDVPYQLQSAQPAGSHYLWSNGLSDTQMSITRSGRYWLEVTYGDCVTTDTIQITVVPTPDIQIGNDSIICMQTPLTVGHEISGATYLWSTGATTPYIDIAETGVYVLALNLNGCIVHDTINITAMPDPDIDLGGDRDICPEQTILLDATYGNNSAYQWNTGDITPTYRATTAGTYIVQVTSEHQCVSSDTVTLNFYPKPDIFLGRDTTVCEETPLTLRPALVLNADSVIWSDGSVGHTLTITHGNEYIATAFNKCGSDADTILVTNIFCDIWLPNAFTPDGDGRNDIFRVLGNIGRIETFSLGIYNRWGERVFLTNDKYKGWDGQNANLGTYVYLLEYSIDGKPYMAKGSFHLLR